MLSHVTVGVKDLDRALAFYAPVVAELGLAQKFSSREWAGWMQPDANRPLFIISRPFDGRAAEPGNGQMIAFLAASRFIVDACHAKVLEHGGTSEGGPGLRPQYHPNYCGAYVRDPDGNKLCVCCHDPDPSED